LDLLHPAEGSAPVLNVDGSSLGNPGASGFGGVLRNSDGSWIGSLSGSVGFSNV